MSAKKQEELESRLLEDFSEKVVKEILAKIDEMLKADKKPAEIEGKIATDIVTLLINDVTYAVMDKSKPPSAAKFSKAGPAGKQKSKK